MNRLSGGLRASLLVGVLATAPPVLANTVIDDSGRSLTLAQPAQRIVRPCRSAFLAADFPGAGHRSRENCRA
ncbi:exported hypothetical protein [Burkholderiales bacterium]|nr:exported hypothetical protein [Burkholderiales bacterium]